MKHDHYTELDAKKLATEYSHLINATYFPYGNGIKEGKEFLIRSIEPLENIIRPENRLFKKIDPEEYKNSKAWRIIVAMVNADEIIEVDLNIVLENLRKLR